VFVVCLSLQNGLIPGGHHLYDVLAKTIAATQQQSMSTDEIKMNSESVGDEQQLSSKEKRAHYMSQLRGANDSEYRRIERENNARAMRRKRLENPRYREQERRQNRMHMAELRRDNPEYRQREHMKNRHRMAIKRGLVSQTPSNILQNDDDDNNNNNNNKLDIHSTSTATVNGNVLSSIYQTLESNLQAAHISFIPYQTVSPPHHSPSDNQQRRSTSKRRTEYELLQQVDEYCRQQERVSFSETYSRSAGSSSSTSSC
jgi:hypothetical protein